MKYINEQELDHLIRETVKRQALLDDINNNVMTEIRHSARKQQIRQWARIVAFAFGLPALTAITIALAATIATVDTTVTAIGTALSATVFAVSVISIICNFSIKKV